MQISLSSHRSLELFSVFSVALLLCRGTWLLLYRGTWLIALVEKMGLRPPLFFFWRHSRGTLRNDLCYRRPVVVDVCFISYECISVLCSTPIAVIGNALTIVGGVYQSICCFFTPFEVGIYPGNACTRKFCEFCTTPPVPGTSCEFRTTFTPVPDIPISVLSVGYTQNHTRAGITLQRTYVTSVGHSYPYPELLEVLYAGGTKTRGTGAACLYLPGTSASSARPCHNIRKFWKF